MCSAFRARHRSDVPGCPRRPLISLRLGFKLFGSNYGLHCGRIQVSYVFQLGIFNLLRENTFHVHGFVAHIASTSLFWYNRLRFRKQSTTLFGCSHHLATSTTAWDRVLIASSISASLFSNATIVLACVAIRPRCASNSASTSESNSFSAASAYTPSRV